MVNNKGNNKVKNLIFFIFVLLIFSTSVPFFSIIFTNSNIYDNQDNLKNNDFSKEDYSPIIEEKKHGLGNITIYDMTFSGLEIGHYIYNASYPLLWYDYDSGALNITSKEIKFIETNESARIDNLNSDLSDRNEIKVKLNETLKVWYDNPNEGFLIYRPRLYPCYLTDFYVFNGTDILELSLDDDYYIDGSDFLVFDYKDYFKNEDPTFNFTMYLIWEYDLTIDPWNLNQYPDELNMIKAEQNFTAKFNYEFTLTGKMFQADTNQKIPSENVDVALTVFLPDRDLLDNHSLLINNETVATDDHLNFDKSINITLSDSFSANESKFFLNFTANYILRFIDPVSKTWAIDRLVALRNIRESIYFPSPISGPRHIYLSYVSIYEPATSSENILSINSLFERGMSYFDENITDNGGIRVKVELPYMLVGETCPFSVNYVAVDKLKIIVTDNIKMPIMGLKLRIYYYGLNYGTYISNNRTQPIAPLKTNENGAVSLNNVPKGNYTVEVYQYGNLIMRTNVSTYNEINYIYTNIMHIPIWILIFGSINGSFLIIGIIVYVKNKKSR